MAPDPDFVTTDWLEDHLAAPDLVVVDGSWYLPDPEPRRQAPNTRPAISRARCSSTSTRIADHDDLACRTCCRARRSSPAPWARSASATACGSSSMTGSGLFSAPRVWWTLRTFGARDVAMLEGGAPEWRAEGRPWTDEPARRRPAVFTPRFDHAAVADPRPTSRAHAGTGSRQVVDARAGGPLPRRRARAAPGCAAGPHAGQPERARSEISRGRDAAAAGRRSGGLPKAGVDLDRPVVTSCGSGVSAAILTLALESDGKPTRTLYDGSWAEWGGRDDCPVATGRGAAER